MTMTEANRQQIAHHWQVIWALVNQAGGEARIPLKLATVPLGAEIHETVDDATGDLVIRAINTNTIDV